MNDHQDRRSSNRVRAQLESARSAGTWMPWAASSIAVAIWLGIGALLYSTLGLEALLALPVVQLIGGFLVILAPGLGLIAAGIMAREAQRSAQANALVLSSARLLLEPAEHTSDEIATMAGLVSKETQRVNRSLSEIRNQMDELRAGIESSITSALKAAEIVRTDTEVVAGRMSNERQGLTELSTAIRAQADDLAKSIPLHAQMLSEAARKAQDEVLRSNETMDQRLRGLDDTSRRLAERIDRLDTMGAESRKRAQNLAGALMRLDEQLVQSTRMVDSARQAGELATAASKNTADALRDAMSDALDAALKANETISVRSSAASEEAQLAMTRLQEMGVKTESATRAAGLAVRQQADETEERMARLADHLLKATTRATRTAESGLDHAQQKIERASLLLDKEPEIRREPPAPAAPAEAQRAPLFRVDDAPQSKPTASAAPLSVPTTPAVAHSTPTPVEDASGLSWRELLTGVDGARKNGQRDDTASIILSRLDQGGVRLSAVSASDLRRIAFAAHQGDRQRRRATRDVAPGEIQRVSQLLDRDVDLQNSARNFIAVEEPTALQSLASAQSSGESAAPRLSAYLLLDAALSANG